MHSPPIAHTTPQRIHGMLLGTAIGDALGLFWEGLSPGRQARWRAHRGHGLWVVGGRAWVSDDTEHTVMVVRSLLRQPEGGEGFARELGRSLRWWLVRLPAGVGLGTGRAIVKLWMGWGVGRSGVWSAGNGPMMRVAPIGLWFSGDFQALEATVLASTRLTHSDPRAATGALAVAVTVAMCDRCGQRPGFEEWLGRMREIQQESADSGEWGEVLDLLKIYLEPAQSVQAFAKALLPRPDKGVSGYVYHTLGVVLFLFWRHDQDPVKALEQAVELGGDTDTVARDPRRAAWGGARARGVP